VGLAERTAVEQRLIALVAQELWQQGPLRDRFLLVPFGQETHILREAMQALRFARTVTALHVRYAPDFFLLDTLHPERVHLLEYKCTLTPLRFASRVAEVARALRKPQLGRESLGNWEEAAYDNYLRLHNAGVRVAILYYCAYHPRQVLCDFVSALNDEVFRFRVATPTTSCSRTPAINFDIDMLRSLEDFLVGEHQLARLAVAPLCANLRMKLAQALPAQWS
jgi:hypothetical protein